MVATIPCSGSISAARRATAPVRSTEEPDQRSHGRLRVEDLERDGAQPPAELLERAGLDADGGSAHHVGGRPGHESGPRDGVRAQRRDERIGAHERRKYEG
jgi:hypothetical protein